MYKTTYELSVAQAGSEDIWVISDADPTPGAATAALNQIKAYRDIDTVIDGGEGAPVEVFHGIIPYHAIDYIAVTPTRTEVENPTDDTCITDDDEEGD